MPTDFISKTHERINFLLRPLSYYTLNYAFVASAGNKILCRICLFPVEKKVFDAKTYIFAPNKKIRAYRYVQYRYAKTVFAFLR